MSMLCLLALLSLPVAQAQGAPEPAGAPEDGVEGEEPTGPTMSDSERGQLFTGYATKLGAGDRAGAAKVLTDILDDPSRSAAHGQAYGLLGDLYDTWDLKLAAVSAWAKGIELDPERNADKVGPALAAAEAAGDDWLLAEALGNNVGIGVTDGAVKNRMVYVAARHHLRKGDYGTALGILMLGDRGAKGFEDVEQLRGVTLAQQDRHNDALVPLLASQALGMTNERGPRFDNVVQLNVARSHYSAGNYGQAIVAYSEVDRESEFWLDAQFERAWAHFRGDDMNGVVALLMNHESPFFEDWFYPEAHLLRAYALFMMCKFPDASKEMDAFVAKYQPIKAEVDGLVGSMSPADAFADVTTFRSGGTPKLPVYLLRDFRYEDRITEAIGAVERIDGELDGAKQLPGRASTLATGWLTERRDHLVRTEGARVMERVKAAQTELAEMLTGIEITRLDLLSLEAKMYERAAATGTLDFGDRSAKLRDLKKRKRGFRVWPYQGEYWADELGWYVVDSRPDCPDSLASGDKQ